MSHNYALNKSWKESGLIKDDKGIGRKDAWCSNQGNEIGISSPTNPVQQKCNTGSNANDEINQHCFHIL